jgi:hypothetical protein
MTIGTRPVGTTNGQAHKQRRVPYASVLCIMHMSTLPGSYDALWATVSGMAERLKRKE